MVNVPPANKASSTRNQSNCETVSAKLNTRDTSPPKAKRRRRNCLGATLDILLPAYQAEKLSPKAANEMITPALRAASAALEVSFITNRGITGAKPRSTVVTTNKRIARTVKFGRNIKFSKLSCRFLGAGLADGFSGRGLSL